MYRAILVFLGLALLVFSSLALADEPAGQAAPKDNPRYIEGSFKHASFPSWRLAAEWCSEQGGRLPKINGADSLPYSAVLGAKGTVRIDGVGEVNTGPNRSRAFGEPSYFTTPWSDAGLPRPIPTRSNFWTGTAVDGSPDTYWAFTGGSGYISISEQRSPSYSSGSAICVP